MTITIRKADAEDIPSMIDMAVGFLQMSPYRHYEICDESLSEVINLAIAHELAFVADFNDKSVGMVLGLKLPAFFNKDVTIAQEIGWWVDEEYRSTNAGSLLFKAFHEASASCTLTAMSLLATSHPKLKGYLHMNGYTEAETAYFKEN